MVFSTALLLSALISGAISLGQAIYMQEDQQKFNAAEAEKQREWTSQENALSRSFNSAEAQKARDFQLEMDSTKYQRQVQDMEAAGLNIGAIGASAGSSASSASASFGSSGSGSAANSSIAAVNNSSALNAITKFIQDDPERFMYYFKKATKEKKIQDDIDMEELLRIVGD